MMSDLPLDLLAFGAHPDDIEIGMAGAVARHAAEGRRVGLCDLTRGELGSNGTPEERLAEADAAAAVLGATPFNNAGSGDAGLGDVARVNLGLPDGDLRPRDAGQLRRVVELLRRWRPRTVAAPYWKDRHPDHVDASHLITRALFKSGLRRYTDALGEPWRPQWIVYYFINDSTRPSFVLDVTAHYATKREALACHRTQFAPAGDGATQTRLTTPLFQQLIESRDAQFGALTGVAFAEGFVVRDLLTRADLFK